MKILVGAACVVVIAAGSYYLYQTISQRSEIAAAQDFRTECVRAIDRLKEGRSWDGDFDKIGNCYASGGISEAEFQAAVHPSGTSD